MNAALISLVIIIGSIVISIIIAGLIVFRNYIFPHRKTPAKKEGKPCITFEQFLSWYQINPERWHWHCLTGVNRVLLEYVEYTPESNNRFYRPSKKLYWATHDDWNKFEGWVEEQCKQTQEQEANDTLITIMETVQSDIEALKNKINQNAQSEFEHIDKERESNKSFYYQVMTSNGYTLTDEGWWVKNEGL